MPPLTRAVADGLYLPQQVADIIWLLLAAALVFFMQAGFAMVETGLTRAKNAVNIMMKNILDVAFGVLIFWAVGYAIMYGTGGTSWFGWDNGLAFLSKMNVPAVQDSAVMYEGPASWLFQVVFAATAATIVSGAMAGRTKLVAYVLYSILVTGIIYPVTGHWIWETETGWLANLGMRDFAGSTVVHCVGGWCALVGAFLLGPRLGKYNKDGTVNAIPGHNMPLAALGVFLLWFGWYGFNAGSTLVANGQTAHVAVTTTLSAAAGTVAAMAASWIKFGKPDLSMALNGALAGLVGITAPCASVSLLSAVIIGLVAGALVFFSVLFIDGKLKIDDPVGAVSVHGVCGAWGTLAVGFFGSQALDPDLKSNGLFVDGGLQQLGVQAVGVAAVAAYVFVVAFVVFALIKATVGLRVTDQEQIEGLDLGEHGQEAYPDFALKSS